MSDFADEYHVSLFCLFDFVVTDKYRLPTFWLVMMIREESVTWTVKIRTACALMRASMSHYSARLTEMASQIRLQQLRSVPFWLEFWASETQALKLRSIFQVKFPVGSHGLWCNVGERKKKPFITRPRNVQIRTHSFNCAYNATGQANASRQARALHINKTLWKHAELNYWWMLYYESKHDVQD